MAKAPKTFEDLSTRYTRAVVEEDSRAKEALRVYRPTDKQLPFHLSAAPEKILRGGKRAGKTMAVAAEFAMAPGKVRQRLGVLARVPCDG
jgi:hypothetical protein